LDLNQITKNFVDVEYHPDQFPGLVFRLKTPKTATLIFSSGKMVCTGAKRERGLQGGQQPARPSRGEGPHGVLIF
jgi:TATA-box binding protein (TBP) (component of TFIID and TFIIIB)